MKMLVVIESPFSGNAHNVEYAKECLRDSLRRGEYPFASHLLYPLVLNDDLQEDREMGMAAGFAWGIHADLTAVYMDLGISRGMNAGIGNAVECGRRVTYRWLDGRESDRYHDAAGDSGAADPMGINKSL